MKGAKVSKKKYSAKRELGDPSLLACIKDDSSFEFEFLNP
jgi:hypothetical protein